MKIRYLIAGTLIACSAVSCRTLAEDNQRVEQLQNANIRKGDSKESVISKLGQPIARRFTGSEETWIYARDNQRGLMTASAPARLIPVVGMFVAADQLDKQGGYQRSRLTVVFNSSGRVKSVKFEKVQSQSGLSL